MESSINLDRFIVKNILFMTFSLIKRSRLVLTIRKLDKFVRFSNGNKNAIQKPDHSTTGHKRPFKNQISPVLGHSLYLT
jgi:hypothetical protein